MDTDNDPGTGCSVTTPLGTFLGVEHVLTTTVDPTTPPGAVTSVTRQSCSGGALGAPEAVTPPSPGWGIGLNTANDDVLVETHIPLSALGGSLPEHTRMAFLITSGSSTQVIFKNNHDADIIYPPANGRRRAIQDMDGPQRVITLDGDGHDWDGIPPFVIDAPALGTAPIRFQKIYAFSNDTELYFRFDARLDRSGPAPTANNDSYSVRQGKSISVGGPGVLSNDTDPLGRPMTAQTVTPPAHGTLLLQPDGGFTYTNDGFMPTDVFTYKAIAGGTDSNPATVTMTITPNAPPFAFPDAYNVAHGGTLNVVAPGVLSNDTDADGDPKTALLVTGPTHGTLTLNPNGSFTYHHNGTNTLSDTFTYRVSDGQATSFATTVTITIGPDAAPVAVADSYTVAEGGTLNIATPGVLGNDTDVDTPQAQLQAQLQSTTTNGTLTLNPNGSFTYVHNGSETTSDSFTYRVSDGILTSNTVTVSITVTPVNDPPVANADGYTILEDQPLNIVAPGVLGNDTDAEGTTLTASLVTNVQHGTLNLNANGGFQYQPAANYNGTDSFTYAASDGVSSANATVTITITPVNDAPSFNNIGDVTVNEDAGPQSIAWASNISAGPADESGQTLSFVITNVTNSGIFLTQPQISPSGQLTFQGAANANGTAVVTVHLHDTGGVLNGGVDNSGDVVFNINITPVNDPPTITAGATLNYNENAPATVIDNTVTIADVDNATMSGATVSISGNFAGAEDVLALPAPVGAITGSYNAGTGVLTLSGTDTIANYQTALRSVTYRNTSDNPSTAARTVSWSVTDAGAATSVTPATSTINITASNDAPVVTTSGNLAFTENQGPTAIDGGITVTDADNANLTGASVSITANFVSSEDVLAFPGLGAITGSYNSGTGVLTLSGTGTVAQYQQALRLVTYDNTSESPTTATRQITWTATDGALTSTPATNNITVAAVNDPPVLTGNDTQTYFENGVPKILSPALTVADADNANLSGATITITNFVSGQDVLSFTPVGAVTGIFNPGTGVLTLSGSDTKANYQTALRSVAYSNSSDAPTNGTRNIDFVATDGTNNSNTVTVNITVFPVNDAPVITAGGTLNYTENQAPQIVDGSVTVSDVDNPNMDSATVSITGNFAAGEDVLAAVSTPNIIVSYNAGTGVLTLTGQDTKAAYQTLLRSITYANTSDNPSTAPRTVTWVVNDFLLNSAPATSTINVAAVNDAPTVTPSTNLSYTEGQGSVVLDGGVTVTDPDSANISGATVQITGNYASGQDVLAMAPFGGITAVFNAVSGTLTLTGTDTKANYQSALRTVTYTNTSNAPSALLRTVTWNATDTGAATGAGLTSTITVTSINTAPTVTAGNTISYTENAAPTAITPALTVTDPDSANLTGATISLTTNFNSAQDVLAFTPVGSITGLYNSGTGVLTLSGTDTVANYQTALRSVTYFNNSDNPTTGSRTVVYVVTDGTDSSTPANSTVNITAVNDVPVLTVAPTASYTEDAAPVTLSPAMTVTDPDNTTLTGATVSLTTNFNSAQDTLSATPAGSITVGYNSGTGVLTLSGTDTLANYQLVLRSVTYVNSSQSPTTGARGVTWTANDGVGVGNTTSSITVVSVNDAPVVTPTVPSINYTENAAATTLDAGITVTDVDSANLTGATITISANYQSGADVLSFTPVGSVTGSFNAGTGVLTLSGTDTVANYQTALRSVQYFNSSENPSALARTISWVATDGTTPSAAANTTVNVTPVNDAPVLTVGGTLNYTEDQPPQPLNASLTVTDADSANLTGATISITTNFASGQDVLSFTPVGAITGSYNGVTGVLTLSGSDTVANYQLALRSVSYNNTSQNPSALTRTVVWTATDGAATSTPANSTINVTNVNDAPIVTAGGTLNYTENQAATVIDNTITVTDVDSGNATGATVSISAGFQSGADVLSFVTLGPISGSYNAGTGVLTLTGTDTMANYQAALRTVKYFNSSEGPTATPRTISWVVTDGVTPSAPATSTVNVTPVNDPPTITPGANLTYTENDAATAINATLTVTDIDSTNLTGATVQITGNFISAEDQLTFSNVGAITGVLNGAGDTVTFTGTDTVANYQLALRGVKYRNLSDNPTAAVRTVSWSATDGTDASAPVSSSITIVPVNDPPVVTAGATLAYTEQQAATAIDTTITVTDPDSANITGATVTISAGFQSGADILSFLTLGPISGSYNAGTGVLTLSGTDTVANYQAALRTVKFNNTSDAPTTPRTITWVVTDSSAASSAGVTSTINITAVNDAPSFTVGGAETFNEDTPRTFNTANGNRIRVQDPDSGASNITVTINTTHGNINVPGGGVTVTNNNTHSVTVVGTAANIDTAINGLVYTPDLNYNGADTINLHVDDGGFTGTGGALTADASIGITLNPINDPPVLTGPAKTATLIAHMPRLGVPGFLTGVTDPDDGEYGFTSVMKLNSVNSAGCACTVAINNATTGTIDITPNAGFTGTTSFTYKVEDNGRPGVAISNDITVTLTITGPVIYFVKAAAAGNCTLGNECTLATAVTNIGASTDRFIFISDANTHTADVPLQAGGSIIGQGITGFADFDTFFGISPPAQTIARPAVAASRPTVNGTVTMGATATDTTVTPNVLRGSQARGFNINRTTAGNGLVSSGKTSLTVSDMNITVSSGIGVSMGTSSGSFTFGNVTATAGRAIDWNGGADSGTVTFNDVTSSATSAGQAGVSVQTNVSDFVFHKITSTGGDRGIFVSGTTGGTFKVNGTASTAGSGGVISNASKQGARFTNATGIDLNWMTFTNNGTNQATCTDVGAISTNNTDCGAAIDLQTVTTVSIKDSTITGGAQQGINGNDVTTLTMTNVPISNVGDAVFENGVTFVNLKGTCTVSNSDVSNAFSRGWEIQNYSGTLNLTLTGSDFSMPSPAISTNAYGFHIAAQGTANSTATVQSCTFTNFFSAGVRADSLGTGTVTANIGHQTNAALGNTFTNDGLAVQITISDSSDMNFDVSRNSSTQESLAAAATPFIVRKGSGTSGTVTGIMNANNIGNNNANSGSGCGSCNGVSLQNDGNSGGYNVTFTNNVIKHVRQRGFEFLPSIDDDSKIIFTGNTISNPDGTIGEAVFMQSGSNVTDTNRICVQFSGNTVTGTWNSGNPGNGAVRVRRRFAGTSFFLINTGFAGGNAAAAAAHIQAQNPGIGAGLVTATDDGVNFGGPNCPF